MSEVLHHPEPAPAFPARRFDRWKMVLSIAWPLIVANSFWNLQMTIDRLFLAEFSTEAMGAAVAVMGVFWTPMALLQQTASYVTTFVAQYFGAGRKDMIGPAVWQSLWVSALGGFLFLLLIPATTAIFSAMGHAPSMQQLEGDYFVAMCFSALPTAIVAATSGYFTGLGRTQVIMQINGVGLVANAVLDYFMILGKGGFPEMGIAGAGYATAIGTALAALYGLWLVFSDRERREYGMNSGWRWNRELMARFIRFGVPSGMQWALEGLAFSIFLIFIGRMVDGNAALSASSIVVTVMMLSILPALGMAQAAAVLVGQYLGEKRPADAEAAVWSGWQVAVLYIMAVGLTFVLVPGFYLGWFENKKDPELWQKVMQMAPYLLIFVAIFTTADSINLIFSFALKGAGDTRFVTIVAFLLPWPLMVLPTYLLKDQPGAVYLAWGAGTVFSLTQATIFWRRFVGGKWKRMSVIG
ncbi:MAG TPA: MATE family efflux transporter [Turneriella sp.]|nr:MATE family efflux transporter [Turneriella sp.]HMY10341.1 MATE family efflux transporter [Turneriella sp.]HNE18810.1 MATE family efflux transporter [Turneriella sp.]HNJ66015.1 MATE family efflux transporter [Turneriella sp.]HNL09492.1 MATE family efflux transporter [Turneriella sp.]